MGIQEKEYQTYLGSVISYFKYSVRAFFLGNMSSVIPPFAGVIVIAVIVYANFNYLNTPAVDLVAFIYLFIRFTQLLANSAEKFGFLNTYYIQWKKAMELLSSLSWEELEKTYVTYLLEKNKWNVSRAAKDARINRSTFDSRMKKLGIKKE